MSKAIIAGIIAEYNPFHNGHAYQIQATRAAGATHIIAVMSGNFVQRGGPACMPKALRAGAAIACGADLVLELPLPYAMATAERFAFGAVSLLGELGCVDILSFGSECGSSGLLMEIVRAVCSPMCSDLIKTNLKRGITYAAARQSAVETLCGKEAAQVLAKPNNTLAVEYLRQTVQQQLCITPFTVKRAENAHDSDVPGQKMASAFFLRRVMDHAPVHEIAPYVPPAALHLYEAGAAAGLLPFSQHRLELPLLSALRMLPKKAFSALPDLSEGLENRIYNAVRKAASLEELYSLIKTKRYPLSRIRRLIWNAYLGVPSNLIHQAPPYLRILAMNQRGAEILSHVKNLRPLSHALKKLAQADESCANFAQLEARATDLYVLGLPKILPCGTEYTYRLLTH